MNVEKYFQYVKEMINIYNHPYTSLRSIQRSISSMGKRENKYFTEEI